MKKLLLLLILFTGNFLFAQVGIGTDMPNPSTQLEIKSSNRGIIIPQIPLTSITDQTTITAGNIESLLVYNTNTSVTLSPGYYYWYQGSWNRLMIDTDLPDNIVFWDIVNNQFTYIDSNGDVQIINISDLETLTFFGLNADGHTLDYTDEDGVVTSVDLETVIKNFETVTTIINNGDGTYTFANEAGDIVIVDVIGDVVTNIQNQGAIYTEIMNLIGSNSDIFVDNGNGTFTHTTVDGDVVTFDANTTTMVNNADGTYTFTNANGDTITVDVIGDIVTNIQNQGAIYDEIIALVGAPVTADNGLTKTADNIQLGGDLINPTTITTDATNTLAIAGLQPGTVEDRLVVVETDGTLREVKAAMPKFFYMPAIIFDTSVNGTFTRNLHAEYAAQFEGTGNPLLVSSTGAVSAIPTLPASALEYHITYYDTTVFANLSIDANGVLTYDIIGNATEASYMTIVFVVK